MTYLGVVLGVVVVLLVVVCLGAGVVEIMTMQEQTADLKLFCLP